MNGEPFVGRTEELALLDGLLAQVTAGIGGAVLVEGEQGIGKTALLRRALVGEGASGCALAWAAADELGQRSPLWLMAQCTGVHGRLAAVADGPAGWGRAEAGGQPAVSAASAPAVDPLAAAAERLLARVDRWCAASPVVLVTEDLQWADEASLRVWQRLARMLGQVPLLLVGSLRPGPMCDELDRLRRGLDSLGGQVISLGPLAPQELSELSRMLVGGLPRRQLDRVVRRAGGNPLYTRELMKTQARDGRVREQAGVVELFGPGEAGVPASLAGTIRTRLSALPQEVAKALPWAAVLGREFTVTDLAAVTGQTIGQLIGVVKEAVTAGMIGEAAGSAIGEVTVARAGPRLAFRHDLIRQVLYDDMPTALRAALHLQAARALAGSGAAPERIASQLAVTPESMEGWALEWLADAAPALSYRAPMAVAELLPHALSRLSDGDQRREALEASMVTAAFLLARDEEVQRAGGQLAARARDPDRAAEAAWQVGYSLMRTGRLREASATAKKAAQRAGISKEWTARLSVLRALTMGAAGQPGSATSAGTALALAEAADDRLAIGYALYALCLVQARRSHHTEALKHVERALDVIGDDSQAADLRLLLLSCRVGMLEHLDRQGEAGATIRDGLALAERVGIPRIATVCQVAAEYYFTVGQWDDSLAMLEGVASLARPGPSDGQVNSQALSALIAGHRDDWKAADEHLAAIGAAEMNATCYPAHQHFLLLAKALVASQDGDPRRAAAVLSVSLDPAHSRHMRCRFALLPMLVRLAVATDDTAKAAAAAQAAAREARREPVPVKIAAADICRGLLAGDPGTLLTAAAYYASARRPLECAQATEDAAVLFADTEDRRSARRALGDAVELYTGLGAHWDVRRATSRLRDHGIRLASRKRRPAPPSTGWQALTPTETKVANLIARGKSNPDIAAELWLSRNTVQTHVSHILAKLSAKSRVEIAREALRHPPSDQPVANRLTA